MNNDHDRTKKSVLTALTNIDRNLSIALGMVIMVLMGIIAFFGTYFYENIAQRNETELVKVISTVVAQSMSQVSFAGKHHSRNFIDELSESEPRVSYIVVVDSGGLILAHSDKTKNDTQLQGEQWEVAQRVLASKTLEVRAWTNIDQPIKEVARPFTYGYRGHGVVFVGMSETKYLNALRQVEVQILVLVLALTLFALAVVWLLSRRFGAPVKVMAFQLKGILEFAPLSICIVDGAGNLKESSDHFQRHAPKISPALGKELKKVIRTGSVRSCELAENQDAQDRVYMTTTFPIEQNRGGETVQACAIFLDITERRSTLLELRRRESLLMATFNATADGLLIFDTQGGILTHNARFVHMWRLDQDLVDGQDLTQFKAHMAQLLAEPRALEPKSHGAEAALNTIDSLTLADSRVFERYISPLYLDGHIHGWVWSFRDITKRAFAESQLRESETYNRMLLEYSPMGLALYDLDGHLVDINPTFAQITGHDIKALSNMSIFDIFPDEMHSNIQRMLQRISKEGRDGPREWRLTRSDGQSLDVQSRSLKINLKNKRYILSSIEDITQQKRATQELERHRKELESLLEAQRIDLEKIRGDLHQKARLAQVGEYTSALSQSIMTPLDRLSDWVDDLSQNATLNREQTRLEEAIRAAKINLQTCTEIIEVLRTFTDEYPLNYQEIYLASWLKKLTSELIGDQNIALNIDIDPQLRIHADTQRLRQVLYNIIEDALQAIEHLSDGEAAIGIESEVTDDTICLNIEDNGLEVLGEIHPLTKPFFMRKGGGIGLGRPIIEGIIAKHGGHISYQSIEGTGNRVKLCLPSEN